MKKIRILSVIVFAISLAAYVFLTVKHSRIDDRIAPRISMDSNSIEVSVHDEEEVILQGVSASDSNDGDVSDTLIVETMGQFLSPGRRNVTIAAVDGSGNVAKETRQVTYSDYTPPKFEITEALRFPINTNNILEYVTASDCLDGDLTRQIKISSSTYVDTTVADDYDTILTVTNSAGDTTKLPCTVTIYDNATESGCPQFELSEYLVYVPAGSKINPWNYVSAINMHGVHYERAEADDGNLHSPDGMNIITPGEVSIKGDVDFNTPGTYEYKYKITDSNNRTGRIRLIVVVE